jgi:hypothetical protein
MDHLQDSMHVWEKPASIGDGHEDRPRKKRRKYIARAWYVYLLLPYQSMIPNVRKKAMNANAARSNAMARRHAIAVDDSALNVFTWRTHPKKVLANKSM